jgi:hypothetical protein
MLDEIKCEGDLEKVFFKQMEIGKKSGKRYREQKGQRHHGVTQEFEHAKQFIQCRLRVKKGPMVYQLPSLG